VDDPDNRAAWRPRLWLRSDLAPGVVLVAATVAALVLVNSPAGHGYTAFWNAGVGPPRWGLHLQLRHWVGDALMTVFFFVIGLEIKQELVVGQLRRPRNAAVPVLAAVGGALVPALVFAAVTWGRPEVVGWGIPMATDPAFAVGLLALLARGVPAGVRVLLLAFATVDDVLAVMVIAIGYPGDVSWPWLVGALAGCVVVVGLRRAGAAAVWPYLLVGVLVWYATLRSGVHATIAGVALALLTPAGPVNGRAVLEQLLRVLTPVNGFLVVPIFALANAGIDLTATPPAQALGSRVTWAVLSGLLVGKFLGVAGTISLATATGLGRLPTGVTNRHVAGLGLLGALGFTVALFITELAYTDPVQTAHATLGILAASIIAAAAAGAVLTGSTPQQPDP
jgi:Na+:H+ antiporter, NhaA family